MAFEYFYSNTFAEILLLATRSSGMILSWSQESSTLIASGDVRHIRLWDVKSEKKIQDIPTGDDTTTFEKATCDGWVFGK